VLGASGTFPTPQSPATGFLIKAGTNAVWIDAGTGTFANLQRHVNYFDLGALVLSHMHLDHILDIYALYYGLRYAPDSRGPLGMKVLAPDGSAAMLEKLLPGGAGDGFGGFFKFDAVASGDERSVGPFLFQFQRSVHPVETMAMKIQAGGRTLVYTADTGPGEEMRALAEGADLLIAEASFQEPKKGMEKVHMTAEEAGMLAASSGVKRLALTHIVPGLDPLVSIQQAKSRFAGDIYAAYPNLRLTV